MTHGPVGDSSSGLDYEETEHAGRVVRIASVAALGGLLFGYDSAVINGAVSAIEDEFGVGGFKLGFAVASALLGAAAGALTAGRLADKIGRIAVMKIAALLFLISAIGAGLSYNFVGTNDDFYLGLPSGVWMLVVFRIIGGIGVGVASVIAPMYIAETSPPRIRGRLGSLQQLAIVTGIFLSLAIDYLLAELAGGSGEDVVAGAGGLALDVHHDGGAGDRSTVCWPSPFPSRRATSSRNTAFPRPARFCRCCSARRTSS